MKMKYIVVSRYEMPIVFCDLMQHVDVATKLGHRNDVVGAGFCYINDDGLYTCYGESISLSVKSRGDVDAKVLNTRFGLIDSYL